VLLVYFAVGVNLTSVTVIVVIIVTMFFVVAVTVVICIICINEHSHTTNYPTTTQQQQQANNVDNVNGVHSCMSSAIRSHSQALIVAFVNYRIADAKHISKLVS
jgi:hypothetical protein